MIANNFKQSYQMSQMGFLYFFCIVLLGSYLHTINLCVKMHGAVEFFYSFLSISTACTASTDILVTCQWSALEKMGCQTYEYISILPDQHLLNLNQKKF